MFGKKIKKSKSVQPSSLVCSECHHFFEDGSEKSIHCHYFSLYKVTKEVKIYCSLCAPKYLVVVNINLPANVRTYYYNHRHVSDIKDPNYSYFTSVYGEWVEVDKNGELITTR